MESSKNNSYYQILKVTGVIGGTKAFNVIINIIKTKIVAVLLGPFGIGLEGLLLSGINLIGIVTGLGLNFSAVRDIAAANSKSDIKVISTKIYILRKWIWATGIIGMIVVLVMAETLSLYTFGNVDYTSHFRLLSVSLLFGAVSGGQTALLQGLRRIKDMAKASVTGVMISFVISISLYFLGGVDAIVPVIIVNSIILLFRSWWYARKVEIVNVVLTIKEVFLGGIDLLKIGIYRMLVGFLGKGTHYLVISYLAQNNDINVTGYFKASWGLAAIYLNFILDAMAADFYPKLSGFQNDNIAINRLVNEQATIAILLAGPIILAMLAFADFFIVLFYSKAFLESVPLLNWLVFATMIKIVSWPLSYVLLAKGRGNLFFLNEVIWQSTFLLVFLIVYDSLNILSAGIAYLVAFVISLVFLQATIRKLTRFKWTTLLLKHFTFFFLLSSFIFLMNMLSIGSYKYIIGLSFVICATYYSYLELSKIITIKNIFKRNKEKD